MFFIRRLLFALPILIGVLLTTGDVLQGTMEVVGSRSVLDSGIELVYQAPRAEQAKGLLLLAHGCSHSGTDWWPRGDLCPTCLGLPVEKSIVLEGLRRGYLVMALSSVNRKRRCWSDSDMPRAIIAIKWVLSKHNLTAKTFPIHLLGASSGGSFVGHIALRSINVSEIGAGVREKINPFAEINIRSAVIQISTLRVPSKKNKKLPARPGLLFMHMTRDSFLSSSISAFVRKADSPSVREMTLAPKTITPDFFSDKGHLTTVDSRTLVQSLMAAGHLSKDGQLLEDPRRSDWRPAASKALPGVVPNIDSLVADESGISELLNMCWAQHEISNDNLHLMYDFMAEMEL